MADSEEEFEKLRGDVQQLREDINVLLADFRELGARQGSEAFEHARQTGESVLREARAVYDRADKQVRKDPLTSVLSAFAIGFVVGRLLDRRR